MLCCIYCWQFHVTTCLCVATRVQPRRYRRRPPYPLWRSCPHNQLRDQRSNSSRLSSPKTLRGWVSPLQVTSGTKLLVSLQTNCTDRVLPVMKDNSFVAVGHLTTIEAVSRQQVRVSLECTSFMAKGSAFQYRFCCIRMEHWSCQIMWHCENCSVVISYDTVTELFQLSSCHQLWHCHRTVPVVTNLIAKTSDTVTKMSQLSPALTLSHYFYSYCQLWHCDRTVQLSPAVTLSQKPGCCDTATELSQLSLPVSLSQNSPSYNVGLCPDTWLNINNVVWSF